MATGAGEKSVDELLRETKIEVAPATYVLVGLRHRDWNNLLQEPELSPNVDAPFLIFRDPYEVTLVIESEEWRRMKHALRDAKVEENYRLLTLDQELPWTTVGYFARVAEILAAAQISIGALSSFSRDHLLIKQDDLPRALRVLSQHVGEVC